MALQKQPLAINFSSGVDTKNDPFQLEMGKFLNLQNSIFQTGKRLQKRNGYGQLTSLPDSTSTFVTTFNGNLTAIGTSIEAFSAGSETWVNKGSLHPVDLDVLPLIRSNTNQSQNDSAIAANGLICTVFTDNIPSGGSNVAIYKYVVADSTTGQNIIAPTVITPATGALVGSPRVFLLGNYFIIVFSNLISATNHLQYMSINTATLVASVNVDISAQYTPATTVNFDGIVVNNSLYLAWNGSDGGGAIRMTYIDSTLTQHSTVTFAGRVATLMSVTADTSNSTAIIWATFYDSGGSNGYTLAVNQQLTTVLALTQWITGITVLNVTSSAISGINKIIYEVNNNYSYDTAVPTHVLRFKTATQAGVISSSTVLKRSLGLASKAFQINGVIYFLGIYYSVFQPTYFLLNSSGNILSRFAYSNAGNYLTLGLPSVTVRGINASVSYLFKDLISSVNKTQGAANAAGIYSQTGINLVTFNIGTSVLSTAEIGSALQLSGGFLWMYDGYTAVENGFFVWPDNVEAKGSSASGSLTVQQYFYQVTYEWADNQGNIFRSAPSIPISITILTAPANFTGNRTSGSPILTGVSSIANLQVGQAISGTGIPASTFILSIDSSSQITMTNNATSGTATSTTVTPITITSVAVNIPTLRLTYKTANPVKIVVYRWSTAQQIYYQTSSVSIPTLNDTTIDFIVFTDSLSDALIAGNSIIYTTGGIVENIGPPATDILTLYKSRLFLVDAEDRNLLWYSKQVIEATPVEMSDLFTFYVAPTTSAEGSTGPITALSALDDKIIIFKKDAIYYITGTGPDNTGANNDFSEPIFISSTIGCANQNSIVFMPDGLMFQSDKGIWLLGRNLSTQYIGAPVEAYNNSIVESAIGIPGTNQVRFTLNSGITLMYDYYYGQWGTFTNIPSISSTLYESLHTFINSYGKVYQETPGEYLDGSSPVLMSFTTNWFNLAGLQGYERFYFMYLLGSYISPHKLSVQIAYDYNSSPSQQTIISPTNYSGPWGDDATWGSNALWGGQPSLEQWQIFTQKQRCQAFQLTINEIFDPFYGTIAGAGLTLSGLNLIIGLKKPYVPLGRGKQMG